MTIDCHIEAYPGSVNYWLREGSQDIIENNDKYLVHEETKDYKTHLTLAIRSLAKEDLAGFSCLAKNVLGIQEGPVKLHGKLQAAAVSPQQSNKTCQSLAVSSFSFFFFFSFLLD